MYYNSFEKGAVRKGRAGYSVLIDEIKDYNSVIDGQNFFDQSVRNDIRIYDNIRKIAMDQKTTAQLVTCLIIHI